MKIKIRPHDATSMPEEDDWLPTDDWLAALRDDGRAEPAGHGHAQPASGSDPRPEAPAEAAARAEAAAPAQAGARAEAAAPAQAGARAEITGRAVIGDQLRMPVMWCEMGSCISWHADPAALGEADTRARAIGAGWRIDALGRLACPRCQQTDPGFRATRPVVLWDRYTAIARAARITALPGNSTAGNPAPGNGRDLRHPASPAASPPEPGWRRQYPAAQATPAVGAPSAPPAPPFPPRGPERGPGLARLRRPPDAPGKPASIRD